MRKIRMALCAAALGLSSLAAAQTSAPATEFKQLLDAHWAWYLKNSPIYATMLGVHDYDREIGDPSLAAADRQAREAQGFIDRLDRIPDASLSAADRSSKAILRRLLSEQVEGNRFSQRAMLFTSTGSWHDFFASLPERLPFFTRADYESYLARLAAYPAYNRAAIDVVRTGLGQKQVQPCVPMRAFGGTITGVIVDDPTRSRFYKPFAAARPAAIPEGEWTALQARAKQLIVDAINPAYRELADFYAKDYAPKCRQTVGLSALPQGKDYYAYLVRVMTTTERTPDDIHKLGLSEVARIRAEMDDVVAKSGFKGDRAAYVAMLRSDPQYYAKTPGELMREASYLAKIIDGWMPKLFGKLPRLPYTVKEIPAETAENNTTAYYNDGSPATGQPGVYFVNTSKLDQRPLYELPALTVHEAVPGHHQQIALQQELDLPMFRRYAAFFIGFTEGWGLYSERLGIEMGLYDTPAKEMGRLSYEMWRACRLVVDTGLHTKGWTRDQAIQYMLDNTALSRANIEAEVDRYITTPGQALAYKLGELKIRELRAKAEKQLGDRFDLRAFHDAVLEQGSVPLDVLEVQVDAWIAAGAKR